MNSTIYSWYVIGNSTDADGKSDKFSLTMEASDANNATIAAVRHLESFGRTIQTIESVDKGIFLRRTDNGQ